MSPDRLAELRRQRALVAQHLAWIDAELIAAGAGPTQAPAPGPAAPPSDSVAPPVAGFAPPAPTAATEADPALVLANTRADEIIEKYRATEALDPQSTKRGCLLLIGAAFAVVGAVMLAIYYFGYASK